MKKFTFLIFIAMSGVTASAQNLDSLYAVWEDSTQSDSNRVNAYKDYIWYGYLFSQPDSAVILAEALHAYATEHEYLKASAPGYNLQGIAYAVQGNYPLSVEYHEKNLAINEQTGDLRGTAGALNNIGNIHRNQGNYSLAMECYQRAVTINEAQGNKEWLAFNYANISNIYSTQGNNTRALEFLQKGLAILEELGGNNLKGISNNLSSIGLLYSEQGNHARALEYHHKSLAIREEIGDKSEIASTFLNIGSVYLDQENYPLALEYFEKSLAIAVELQDKKGIARNLNNIGNIYFAQNQHQRALDNYQKSLALKTEIGDKQGASGSLTLIGVLYHNQGKQAQALDYCHQGLKLAEEIGAIDRQRDACDCLYTTYKTLGKGNEALIYVEKIKVIDDSLSATETARKLEQMEFAKVMLADSIAKAEEARLVQEAHQEEVRKKNHTRNLLSAGGIMMLLLAGGIYSRLRYTRKAKKIIETEKDRSENLLLNILPADIARELKEKGRADARDFDKVSILFTDFKGFTEQSAKLSAAELVSEINHCFEAFDGIMEKYGIEKIKTIGDAYMAAGGLPIPSDDSIKNTVLAALEMQKFIVDRKAELESDGKPFFEMRVGIHTGPVVAGIVGVKKFQYDIWGDTVNTASRMESSGDIGQVNISHTTYDFISHDPDFVFTSRGKVQVKGKGELEMHFVKLSTE